MSKSMSEIQVSSEVEKLIMLTEEMLACIGTASYEECESFVEERERIVNLIAHQKNLLSIDDRNRLRKLTKHEHLVISRMQTLRDEASEWLKKQEVVKVQRSAYNHGYSPDSMFFDRRN